jgi:putative colanic acid biosysnthesis UDP-glucose lipid carrier transferase
MHIETNDLTQLLGTIHRAEETPVLSACLNEKKTFFIVKRIFDILVSVLVIVFLLSWLLPIIAIVIKLNSRGPVFFKQKRTGRGGQVFTCYKLRTMVVNPQADEIPAVENDPRITGVGRILRKSNLDELPQFFNILLGSMSIAGPRPHMIYDCARFENIIEGYRFRNLVKPGITGLAQIKGYHGPAFNTEAIFLRYQWDAFYIRNANFLLDLKIIRKTITSFLL